MNVRISVLSSRALLAGLALAAAACEDSATIPVVGLDQPTDVAVFQGITHKKPGVLTPYLAIANGGRDDLTLVDVTDGVAVLAPVLVRPMVIPTSSRPTRLVSASLRDGGADLLVVVPAGTATLQVVRTWSEDNRVVEDLAVDIGDVAPGAEILSAIAVPVPHQGTPEAEPGKARIVLGLTDRRLAVVDFVREPGGDGVVPVDPARRAEVQPLEFEPVSLAASPDARRLFAATPDDLPAGSGIHGVVDLDVAGAPGTWTASMLPTRAPTRLVVAARVQERVWADNDLAIPEDAPWVLRVYATLDPSGCGPDRPIDCGLVVVDPEPPVSGLVPDPLGELPYQPPIRLPAQATALAAAIPPSVPPEGYQRGRMAIFAQGDLKETTGVVVAATTNGRVYSIDLGRRTIHSERKLVVDESLDSPTRVRIRSVEFQVVDVPRTVGDEARTQTMRVMVCDRTRPGDACRLPRTTDEMRENVEVGPGYATAETFRIVYRGGLSGLSGRRAQVGEDGGQLWLAIQLTRALGGFTNVARLYDPALGVHLGDIVEIQTGPAGLSAVCDDGVADDPVTLDVDESTLDFFRARVAGFALPDPARFPGGALLLEDDSSACYAALRSGHVDLFANVRADGWVMQGDSAGYLGRATLVSDPDDLANLRGRYTLRYVNEDAPEQACPLAPWPAAPETVTCLGECRDRCERLSIARKSRRWYTLAESCEADEPCRERWGEPAGPPDENGDIRTFSDPFPNRLGPLLDFLFTVRNSSSTAPVDGADPTALYTGHGIVMSLENPYEPSYRVPGSGAAVMPVGIAPFDASPYDAGASYRFYVAYTSDVVLGYTPSLPLTTSVTIR